jgi:acetate kinase
MSRAWEQKEALLEQQHNQLEQGLEDLIAGGSEPSHLPQMMHLIQKLKLHLRLEERWLSEAGCLCQGHRLSHGAIARRFPKHKLISAHLGAGCSLAVIKNGHCIDTTMGYTPLDGLVMASRSGSVDPGILLELLAQGVTAAELEEGLQKRSGLLGLSGRSGDMQELRQLAMAGNADANLAIAVFQQQLLKAIGAGFALLGGLDVLALTGGIGEHDQVLRQWLTERLQLLGTAQIAIISANEELEIYQQITALR